MEFRDAKRELLENYKEDFDFVELGKLAIHYSDGVIEGGKNVNSLLMDYATEKNIPTLKYPGDEGFADAYNAFYDLISGESEK